MTKVGSNTETMTNCHIAAASPSLSAISVFKQLQLSRGLVSSPTAFHAPVSPNK